MSAKDAFIKKSQENFSKQQALAEKILEDTKYFCARLYDLTKEIDLWLDKTCVTVKASQVTHNDANIESLPDGEKYSKYQTKIIKMQNGLKSGSLTPFSVYGDGANGWCLLEIDNPYNYPRVEKFWLRLYKESHSWSIRRDVDPSTVSRHTPLILPEEPLTEDSFFQAIKNLA
ncbi:TPA: hypothetical protein JHJ56_003842 [Raoultella ornithinolytica]|nr:hypothetical protein [Raoultella ornithinolytica]HAV2052977.1 hypothetical protein [Raoultella ornithinolytica]